MVVAGKWLGKSVVVVVVVVGKWAVVSQKWSRKRPQKWVAVSPQEVFQKWPQKWVAPQEVAQKWVAVVALEERPQKWAVVSQKCFVGRWWVGRCVVFARNWVGMVYRWRRRRTREKEGVARRWIGGEVVRKRVVVV